LLYDLENFQVRADFDFVLADFDSDTGPVLLSQANQAAAGHWDH